MVLRNQRDFHKALTVTSVLPIWKERSDVSSVMPVVKVKLSLCLTKQHVMKTYGGVGVLLHAFLTWALVTGQLDTPAASLPVASG
jgi:hypothetical protein